ncbi:hypothetical protein A2291_02370 [candidate division WOR-1 bacterium RIFOXYB2_FULL_42_35]|uniref:Uncharacterized protein n=1 Tax=candidate division WOR-1 bacterium RIFOXYC2_FULL_41_25 TaxID=1802586 RepID=A0A1F4TP38_UNCSA|nr:MAG: hypothetical protein A2247_05275 [candidate division WOR-1 bacterium RIFOXYA2_FULL_41_14]OGC25071.1 MAG: hypothetical protein A2291_02370 [candidate division WOR-1 bacterium RIFOXYB2_FULL_42_35]OGC34471.1 MAG: hypothetical protein A2462_04190 [candidate division WOR-1 bacterium RIFOXYC2_FULL_41_25]OGC43951.1 MAG: hypothetical protein A2548_05530 [candidate division WOR-1 bacterium RIFOXYD2_FULL_41_8]
MALLPQLGAKAKDFYLQTRRDGFARANHGLRPPVTNGRKKVLHAGHFVYGLGARAFDALTHFGDKDSITHHLQTDEVVVGQAVGVGGVSAAAQFNLGISQMVMSGTGGPARTDDTPLPNVLPLEQEIYDIIRARPCNFYSFSDIKEAYSRRYERPLGDAGTARRAIEGLRIRGRIQVNEQGAIRVFDQIGRIREVFDGASTEVTEIGIKNLSLHQLFAIIFKHYRGAGLGEMDMYLYNEPTGELLRIGDSTSHYRSNYEAWAPSNGIFETIISGGTYNHYALGPNQQAGEVVFFENVPKQVDKYPAGSVSRKNVSKYQEFYYRPRQIRFSSLQDESGNRVMAVKRQCWEREGSHQRAREFYCPDQYRKVIDQNFATLDQWIASQIGEVLSIAKTRTGDHGLTLRSLWDAEDLRLRGRAEGPRLIGIDGEIIPPAGHDLEKTWLLDNDPAEEQARITSAVRLKSDELWYGKTEIRVIHLPYERGKLDTVRGALVKVYMKTVMSIYRQLEEYKDLTDEELMEALLLDDIEDVLHKTLDARYLCVLITGGTRGEDGCLHGGQISGFVSGRVQDAVQDRGTYVGQVFKVPVAMVTEAASERGLLTRVTVDLLTREMHRLPISQRERGFPVFAWSQSGRVIGPMLELRHFWMPGVGLKPSRGAEATVRYFSRPEADGRVLDDNLIARGAYKRPIRVAALENFQLRKKGPIAAIRRFFRGMLYGLLKMTHLNNIIGMRQSRYSKIDDLLAGRDVDGVQLAPEDALPVFGWCTWTGLQRMSLVIDKKKTKAPV